MGASLNGELLDVLEQVEEFLDRQVDIVDGPDGPLPNEAMQLHAAVRDVLLRLAARADYSAPVPVRRAA